MSLPEGIEFTDQDYIDIYKFEVKSALSNLVALRFAQGVPRQEIEKECETLALHAWNAGVKKSQAKKKNDKA